MNHIWKTSVSVSMPILTCLIVPFAFSVNVFAYDWQEQPEKAAIMLVHAHPDDEAIFFGGSIPYYAACRQLPMVVIAMTSGGEVGTSYALLREEELRCAVWTYGLRNEPIYAHFEDCCYGSDLQCCWDCWGGQDNAVRYLTEQVRRYQPDVILCHDFGGEYGHPNHMGAGYAAAEAWSAAADPTRYPEQLTTLSVWQAKKCYVHLHPSNPVWHDWDIACDELGGRTAHEVADEGLLCHASQGSWSTGGIDLGGSDSRSWGLYATTVGLDAYDSDFMQNIDLSIYFDIPTPPDNLQVTAISGSEVHLTWSDNSDDEEHFVVCRKPYQSIDAWHELVELPADTTSYMDTNSLYGSIIYTYRVGARKN